MKKLCFILSAFFLVVSCNQEGNNNKETTADTNQFVPPRIIPEDSLVVDSSMRADSAQLDTALLRIAQDVLLTLKQKDFTKLASYVDPKLKLRFSPYAHIDTTDSKAFTPYELQTAAKKSSILKWGSYDGSGDPIRMNIAKYFDKFVYNKDYLNAKEKATNRFLGAGNSLNNLKEIYTTAVFAEFYFPGFDPTYEGLDWQTLRLVFQKENDRLYLVAIVHDQWTI